ncbi:hypothetical protein GCM10022398_04840 [Acetobacter lovaniensis]|nr:hypothetical protein AA0474_2946 [Acetobacter lovaniensis NRIC 0474]
MIGKSAAKTGVGDQAFTLGGGGAIRFAGDLEGNVVGYGGHAVLAFSAALVWGPGAWLLRLYGFILLLQACHKAAFRWPG